MTVSEVRLALTVTDVDAAVELLRDVLGMQQTADWSTDQGRCIVLSAQRATIELIDAAQAEFIDGVEVGRRVSGPVRLALEVPDSAAAADAVRDAGGEVVGGPRPTPWGDRNARVVGPGGVQLTLFSADGEQSG